MNIQKWLNERDFVSLAKEELGVFESLLFLAKRKKKALTEAKLANLGEIVEEEEQLVRRLSLLEARRVVFLAEAGPILSLDKVTLSAIASNLSPEAASDLMLVKERWTNAVMELQSLQAQNQRLLQTAMSLVKTGLRAFRMLVHDHRYSRKGEQLFDRGSLLLNRTA